MTMQGYDDHRPSTWYLVQPSIEEPPEKCTPDRPMPQQLPGEFRLLCAGANPMLTIEATALVLATRLAQKLRVKFDRE